MADTSSTTTFRADISSLRAEMQAASRAVKVANSEFKAATAGMDDWSSSADGLEAKIKQLDATLKAQNKQVELAAEELEKTEKEYGKNSAEADRARIKYNNFKAAAAQTEKALDEYEDQLKDVDKETEEVEESTVEASDGFTVMKGALADLAATAVKSAVRGLGNLAKETFKVGADFQSAMSQVKAVSGASAEEIEALTEKAKEMGAKTKFSASESAEAFNYMAMAGWKTEDMIEGIEGIMNLAAASGADLATTSDIVTDALTAMGYEAKDAGRLADVMAAASSNANTNVEMMGATFQYAAPLVGALGYNMEDTAVAIGMMANAGIKGEKAGTALRSILTRLSTGTGDCADAMEALGISLTKVNDDGSTSMKSLDEVMIDLREAFVDLDEQEQTQYASMLAGQEAMSGLLAIVNGSESDFNKLTSAVANSDGAAQSMANTMNDNVSGALTLLQSNIESKMIQVFEQAAPSIQEAIGTISEALDNVDWSSVADSVGDIATGFADFVKWCLEHGEEITGILKGVGGAVAGIFVFDKVSKFKRSISNVVTAITNVGTEATTSQGLVSGLSALISNPSTWVVAGIAGVTAAVIGLNEEWHKSIKKQYGLNEAEEETISKAKELASQYDETDTHRSQSFTTIDKEYGYLEELKNEYQGLLDKNGNVKEGYEDRANFIITTLAEALGVEREDIEKNIGKNGELKDSIDELIQKKQAEALVMAGQDAYTEAIQNRDEALKTYQDSIKLNEKQEKEYADLVEKNGDVLDTYADLLYNYPLAAQAYYFANREAIEGTKESYNALLESREGLKAAETAYLGYASTIENYEGASAAVLSGDAEAITLAVAKMRAGFISAETGTKESLQQQVKDYQAHYRELQQAVADGMPGVTQKQVEEAHELVKAAVAELSKLPEETQTQVDETVAGFDRHAADFENAGEKSIEAARKGAETAIIGFDAAGRLAADSLGDGINSSESLLEKAGEAAVNSVIDGADTALVGFNAAGKVAGEEIQDGVAANDSALEKAGKAASESVIKGADTALVGFNASGQNAAENLSEGITDSDSMLEKAGEAAAESVIKGADESLVGFNASGQLANEKLAEGIVANEDLSGEAGEIIGGAVKTGAETVLVGIKVTGETAGEDLSKGIEHKKAEAKKSGETVGKAAVSGADTTLVGFGTSGKLAAGSFNSGITSKKGEAASAGSTLASNAKAGTEGADTYSSGQNFALGFINGIGSLVGSVANKAAEMVRTAVSSAKAAQKEGSPSKLTYESGVYFTQGYINGIASEQKNLIRVVQGLVGSVIKEMNKMSGYNFEVTAQRAADMFIDNIDKQTNYMISKIQYQNEAKLEEFDTEIKRLQKEQENEKKRLEKASQKRQNALQTASDKKVKALQEKLDKAKTAKEKKKLKTQISNEKERVKKAIAAEKASVKKQVESSKKSYEKLIDTQKKYQDAYSKASSEMLAEFEQAIADYQTKAEDLVQSTIEGITDRYTERYDALISKQDKLISKLKEAGDLFEVTNAGVMIIGDLQAQTKQITDYTDKLRKIKDKVSAELFDQITEYDVKEGSAFMDRLLAMSSAELQAYNAAYAEKIKAAEKAADTIYGSDLKKVAADYKNELESAFKNLPAQLKSLGDQAMKGFVDGLVTNTDYMESSITTFISGMVDQFKKQLQIKSPSKVMFDIGEYTGEGFVDGITSLLNQAKKAASDLAGVVSQPLSGISGNVGFARSAVGSVMPAGSGVINNYNLVQNNNSPKALTALETYQARRRQIALVKAFA